VLTVAALGVHRRSVSPSICSTRRLAVFTDDFMPALFLALSSNAILQVQSSEIRCTQTSYGGYWDVYCDAIVL